MNDLYLGKRYHTLDYFFKNKFGCKIAKIPLSGGFSCPNRDGTKSLGGCIYCSGALSGDFAGKPQDSIGEMSRRRGADPGDFGLQRQAARGAAQGDPV